MNVYENLVCVGTWNLELSQSLVEFCHLVPFSLKCKFICKSVLPSIDMFGVVMQLLGIVN